mmetsp:Transcript_20494/g.48085  ORF Transcript_20494/g.48085 Transcript_20494/m.48085 type:complete len:116 (-) Transcript_20494:1833-2180(-)
MTIPSFSMNHLLMVKLSDDEQDKKTTMEKMIQHSSIFFTLMTMENFLRGANQIIHKNILRSVRCVVLCLMLNPEFPCVSDYEETKTSCFAAASQNEIIFGEANFRTHRCMICTGR